jgi:tartrate dehydrogenase/decarboxylase/D-malate dehydrogenase
MRDVQRGTSATPSVTASGVVTRDLGGSATTADVTRAVCERLAR